MSQPERKYASAKKRAEAVGGGYEATYLKVPEGVKLFKPKPGTMSIDILPFIAGNGNPWAAKGEIHYERTFFRHDRIGANGDSYVCPLKTAKLPCPICEHRAKLMRDDNADEDEIKQLAPRQRQLFNVVDLKQPDKGIQLFEFSYHSFGKVLDARIRSADEDDNWDTFFQEDDGFYLRVGFAEESFGKFSFSKAESIDFKPRREPLENDILQQSHCLDKVLVFEEYESLKAIFLETNSPKKGKAAAEDEEDEAPPAKRRAPAAEDDDEAPPPKRRAAPPVDDDEAPPPPKRRAPAAEEEDEAPPPPKRRPAPVEDEEETPAPPKRRPAPVAEEDEEAPPPPKRRAAPPAEEEEFEEEAPKPKKRPAPAAEEEDEAPPPPKRRPAPVEDEEEPPAKPAKKPAKTAEEEEWDKFDQEEPPAKPAKKK